MDPGETKRRLAYIRRKIRAECISLDEILELQSPVDYIKPGDTLLLEWAGVPEFPEGELEEQE